MNNIHNDEIIIDFGRIKRIIWYRKKVILLSFFIAMTFAVLLTVILPKKYVTTAKILINKNASTNFAEINPFIRAEIGSPGESAAAFLTGDSTLNNEIEILKSPLVLAPVIKENKIRYTKGHKKGELLSVDDFLKKNIIFENAKGTNVILIKYKNQKPQIAYGVVKGIIENYKIVYEELNSQKAEKDTKFIKKEYLKAKASLDRKINRLKTIENGIQPENSLNIGSLNILSFFDKRINTSKLEASNSAVDTKKMQVDIEQESEKLNFLKNQYEQSQLIGKLSKNASKLVLLQSPILPRSFEYKEPNWKVNLILGIIVFFMASFFAVIISERTDKKLTYSQLGEDALINPNMVELEAKLLNIAEQNIAIIDLISSEKSTEIQALMKQNKLKIISSTIKSDPLKEHIENIKNAKIIILLSKVGNIDLSFYKVIRNFLETSKTESIEIVL